MENSIYNAMISANQLLEKQTIISNNLANISTNGFKEKFNYILQTQNTENLFDNSNKVIKEYYNFSPGMLNYTERNLDVFVKDNGWLTVKDINGQEAYTKNGHLKINSERKLNIQDNEVIGHNCNIKIPNNVTLKILSNGVILAIDKKNKKIVKNPIGALKLVNIALQDLIQKENGLFYLKTNLNLDKYKQSSKHNNDVRIQSGILETSNVNPSKNMIEMISNSRQFEMQMKMISTSDQNSEYANQLININN